MGGPTVTKVERGFEPGRPLSPVFMSGSKRVALVFGIALGWMRYPGSFEEGAAHFAQGAMWGVVFALALTTGDHLAAFVHWEKVAQGDTREGLLNELHRLGHERVSVSIGVRSWRGAAEAVGVESAGAPIVSKWTVYRRRRGWWTRVLAP